MARQTNRVCITTQEEIDMINQDNKELMEEFLDYYDGSHSDKSVVVMKSNLNIFFVWVMKHRKNIDFCDIKKKDILAYVSYLNKNGLSPARVRGLRSSISSLSMYIEDILDEDDKWEGFRNITNKIKVPKLVPVREKTVLSDQQVESYLDKLIEDKKFSHACVLALAWATGRRKSELLRFKVSFVDDKNLSFGCLYKSPTKIKTKGNGKLGKPLDVYIFKPKFKKYFDLWMEERERMGIPNTVDELFVDKNDDGEFIPFGESRLDSYADKFSNDMGVNFYFHCLRHNFTTSLLRAGIPAEVVKEIIGWESVDLVSVYDDRDLTESLDKYFSEDGIKKVEAKTLSDL